MKSTGYSTKITTCLFHIKITVSVKKSLHQHCGPCYLFTLAYFFLYINSPFLLENKFDGGSMGELKILSKNTYEEVHLIKKLLAISLQACKFTKNELPHTYFQGI